MFVYCYHHFFFFFKQKTAYEMRISDWSSDVCSSDLRSQRVHIMLVAILVFLIEDRPVVKGGEIMLTTDVYSVLGEHRAGHFLKQFPATAQHRADDRSEEHTSELQSLMRISYAVFCLKKTKINKV